MLLPKSLSRSVALCLAVLMTLAGAPLAAAAPESYQQSGIMIGSLSAAGPVRLRGVEVARAGTLFSGDTLQTGTDAYARLRLDGGHRIELGGGTDITLESEAAGIRLGMRSGSLAFSATASTEPLRIGLETYEVLADRGSAGEVTWLAGRQVGVRAVEGLVTVRNAASGASFVIGQQDPQDDQEEEDEGEVIILDEPLEPAAPPPAPPPARALSRPALYGIIGGAAGGLILYLALRESASPS